MSLVNVYEKIIEIEIIAFVHRLTDDDNERVKMLKMWDKKFLIQRSPTCLHKLLNGKNAGKFCGKKTCKESEKYCTVHLKSHDKSREKVKTILKDIAAQMSIVIHKRDGNHIDPLTNFVFSKDKKVIGKYTNGKVLELTLEDKTYCIKQKLSVE